MSNQERFPEIKIYASIGENIREITASPSDNVKRLKELINQVSGSENQVQQLYFRGVIMRDDRTIGSYGISKNDLRVDCLIANKIINIMVRFHDGTSNLIHIDPSQTVSKLREAILNIKGSGWDVDKLTYAGLSLQNERTMASYGLIRSGSLVMCNFKLIGGRFIRLQNP
jgi:hypothetical protein